MPTPIVNQGAFTAVAEIKMNKVVELREMLTHIGDTADTNECPVDFKKLKTVHFMRWVILDETSTTDGDRRYNTPPYLMLSTNYDEPFEDHLDDLVNMNKEWLTKIYSHCEEFYSRSDLKKYLRDRQVPYSAFYVGTRGRTVQEIHKEAELRNGIEVFLDQRVAKPDESALDIRKAIQEFVASDTRFQWVKQDDRTGAQWMSFFFGMRKLIIGLAGALAVVFLVGLGALGAWLWWPWGMLVFPVIGAAVLASLVTLWLLVVRWHEWRDSTAGKPNVPIMGASIEDQKKREDQIIQNQLSNIVWVKPGWFRLMTVRLVLALINFLGRYFFVRGSLGGIPTIHFARWVILHDKRVLFFSNFDGSWENYLGDFIDKAATGLTAIWSNCIGCPPSVWLAWNGAGDEPAFKVWVRENQLVTQVWYSSYEDLTVENINNNSYIRLGLAGDMTEDGAKEWLARF